MDFLLNGRAFGPVATKMANAGLDPELLRPYRSDDDSDPRSFVTANHVKIDGTTEPKTMVLNDGTAATLRIREWIQLDQAVMMAARPRMQLVNDIRGRGLEFNIPNGMGKTVLQYQSMSVAGSADISMDGLKKDKNDRPVFDIRNLPLPIIHSDFSFSARDLAVSRNSGTPLDLTMAENAGRRVAEKIETLHLGTAATFAYGGGTIYGLTNSPKHLTFTLRDPTAAGWVRAAILDRLR